MFLSHCGRKLFGLKQISSNTGLMFKSLASAPIQKLNIENKIQKRTIFNINVDFSNANKDKIDIRDQTMFTYYNFFQLLKKEDNIKKLNQYDVALQKFLNNIGKVELYEVIKSENKELYKDDELKLLKWSLTEYLTMNPQTLLLFYKDDYFSENIKSTYNYDNLDDYNEKTLEFVKKISEDMIFNEENDGDETLTLVKHIKKDLLNTGDWESAHSTQEYRNVEFFNKNKFYYFNIGKTIAKLFKEPTPLVNDPHSINLEGKSLFLEFNSPSKVNFFLELKQRQDSLPKELKTLIPDTFSSFAEKTQINNFSKDANIKVIQLKPFNIALIVAAVVSFILFISTSPSDVNSLEGGDKSIITWQEFKREFLAKNLVERLFVFNREYVEVKLNSTGLNSPMVPVRNYRFAIGDIDLFEKNLEQAQNDLNTPPSMRVPVVYYNKAVTILDIIGSWGPTLLMAGGMFYLLSKGAKGIKLKGLIPGGEKKKFEEILNVETKFKDVAGCDEAKQEIMEFVYFLRNPEKYEKLGARIPRGAILSGPPGTGKTLLAKATAGEAEVPFYSVSGAEFVEMYVGMGASRVRDLFETARKNSPSIIFIDEIDAIGKARSVSGGNDEREATLNQILVELDGFKTDDHIVVLAGTNRADLLDKALTRPGRFDRHVTVDNPELVGRKQLFELYLKKVKYDTEINSLVDRLAALTAGFSGADIANCCNEAALFAARDKASAITLNHFEQAIDRTIAGLERKTKLLSADERKIVAYHEAGHAICGWYLKEADPLLKVSIIPRSQGVLGFAQYVPGDKYLMNNNEFLDKITQLLGGRVSEELHFNSVTGGAHDDIKKITNLARSMVAQLGMSEKVGWAFYGRDSNSSDYTKPFSEETATLIDDEVKRIVNLCHKRCKDLLTEKAEQVELLAKQLLEKEVLSRDDLIRLLGKRPFAEKNMDYINSIGEGKPETQSNDKNTEIPDIKNTVNE
ncbi:hypothetical protein QEN19_002578 [Hanseniaspora menglaensis]